MTPFFIDAVIGETERPAFAAACEQLGKCLNVASGSEWTIQSRVIEAIGDVDTAGRPAVVLLSLLVNIAHEKETFEKIEARWRTDISSLANIRGLNVFLCTVFRHIPGGIGSRQAQRKVERIRRLNLLAAELSHDFGITVIDIDRIFAHAGARTLATDYRLGNGIAAEVAAHAMVWSILAGGLDDLIPPDVQEQAKKFHGDMRMVAKLINRLSGRGANEMGSDGPC